MLLWCSFMTSCFDGVGEIEFWEEFDEGEIGALDGCVIILFLVVVSPFLLFDDGGDKALWMIKNQNLMKIGLRRV